MEVNNNVVGMEVDIQPLPEAPKRCAFYLLKKKRNCKLPAREDKKYCAEHAHLELVSMNEANQHDEKKRVPCPLDPKHTVYEHKLEKHLKVCNAIPSYPIYYSKDTNLLPPSATIKEPTLLKDLTESQLLQLLNKISAVFTEIFKDFHRKTALRFDSPGHEGNGIIKNAAKHDIQVQALCGLLDNLRLILAECAFVEMGSGTGELTCGLIEYMRKYYSHCLKTSRFIFVDKASHRHKHDTKLKYEDDIQASRVRLDIKDFALERHSDVSTCKNLVAHSKHLCGEATDLALCALFNGNVADKVSGLVLATCCHHRCKWESFVGKDLLLKMGFSEKDFVPLTAISSWAVCGSGTSKLTAENEQEIGSNPIYRSLNLTKALRKQYGYKVKKILDQARVEFIEAYDLDAILKTYAAENVTGETGVIVARRNVWKHEFLFTQYNHC